MYNRKLNFVILFLCISILTVGCGGRDKQKEIEDIYRNVYEHWQEAKVLIYGALIETGEEVTDEKDQVYFVVEEPTYQDLESIRKVLKSTFSDAYIETHLSWVLEGKRPLYKEIDGRLCVAEMDAVGETPTDEIVLVLNRMENEIIIKVAAEEENDACEFYEITLVQEGNEWVIDQLCEQ